ncbi:hypothetical protein [Posidoniimonas corsicana]|uniref:hypothetical protein n=1 Tax=Posidoniimonas corsicana TaxID=1938618 RepID=UPI0018D27548|nr:hypothetical protein [Posidoniimonas corsicana]
MWHCAPPLLTLVSVDARQALLDDARRLRTLLADAGTRADRLADQVELKSRLHQIEFDLDKLSLTQRKS